MQQNSITANGSEILALIDVPLLLILSLRGESPSLFSVFTHRMT